MAPTSQRFQLVVSMFVSLWLSTEAWIVLPNSHSQSWRAKPWTSREWSLSRSTSRKGMVMNPKSRATRTTKLLLSESSSMSMLDDVSPLLVVIVALGLGVAAQGFINQMLEGDQGLGAYLKDGSGYNKSGFRRVTSSKNEKSTATTKDPLPWLKLPQLDFVEVAGQPSPMQDQLLLEELESLRQQMNEFLDQGKMVEASALRDELESRMKEAGIEYKSNS